MLDYVLSKVANGYSPKANGHSVKKSPRNLANGYVATLNGTKADLDDIDQLTSLISSSAAEIKSRYRSVGLSPPSLDESSASSLDIKDEDSRQAITKATRVIEAASAQLRATISRPEHVLLDKIFAFEESAAIQVASSANIAGLLSGKPKGVHIDELSKSSGIEADKLGRILRFLAVNHIFYEVEPNVFANNKLSAKLAKTLPAKDVADNSRITARVSSFLPDFLLDVKPDSGFTSPFHLVYGTPMMEYHNTPEGKKTVDLFMRGVAGWSELTGKADSIRAFPWADWFSKPKTVKVCDIGAGNGHVMLALTKTFASYRFKAVIQDRPAFIELSKQLWAKEHPQAVKDGRVDYVTMDFFKDSPVDGCDIYYLRHCLHDWDDVDCVTILSNIAKTMRRTPGSILLVHEIVLSHAVGRSAKAAEGRTVGEDIAPAPLLPNFGAARNADYAQDVKMMMLFNSKERTLGEFVNIGSRAGLKFERLWDGGRTSLIQFKVST